MFLGGGGGGGVVKQRFRANLKEETHTCSFVQY